MFLFLSDIQFGRFDFEIVSRARYSSMYFHWSDRVHVCLFVCLDTMWMVWRLASRLSANDWLICASQPMAGLKNRAFFSVELWRIWSNKKAPWWAVACWVRLRCVRWPIWRSSIAGGSTLASRASCPRIDSFWPVLPAVPWSFSHQPTTMTTTIIIIMLLLMFEII